MKSVNFILFALLFIGISVSGNSQKLLKAAYSFSEEKPVYIALNDGTQVEGLIKEIDMKKGLIISMLINDAKGNDLLLRPNEIKSMYVAPAGNHNTGKYYEFMDNPANWDNNEFNQDYFKNGYVYFEQAEVEMGRKTRGMLLQLLNPSFSSKIKVYMDPFVSEVSTAAVGLNARNEARNSYIIKDGDRPAFQLNKGQYQDNFIALFGECQTMVPLKQKAKWSQFEQHLFDFTNCN